LPSSPVPDRREDGGVADDAVDPDLLVPGIEKETGKRAERAGAPGLEPVVHQGGGAADPARGKALEPEPGHDRLDVARRHALDVHLGDGEQ